MVEHAVAAIVLAAGQSSRLGEPKQLVTIDGEALVCRAVRLAFAAACSPVVAVLGAHERACREALGRMPAVPSAMSNGSPRIAANPHWSEGMSTSLRAGVAALADDHPGSVLILLTDQTAVTAASLMRLLAQHRDSGSAVTAARYSGRLGVPAVFTAEVLPELAALTGDQGARHLLQSRQHSAAFVDMPEAAADLDTPEDLLALTRSHRGISPG